MDTLSKEKRSWVMSRIKSKDTKPEITVRKLLHKMGFRYRLQGKVAKGIFKKGVLPGKPDIVMRKYMTVIFVHGCFWHMHKNCTNWSLPKSNIEYWGKKLNKNVARFEKNKRKLENMGFDVVVIWECETKDMPMLLDLLKIRAKKLKIKGGDLK